MNETSPDVHSYRASLQIPQKGRTIRWELGNERRLPDIPSEHASEPAEVALRGSDVLHDRVRSPSSPVPLHDSGTSNRTVKRSRDPNGLSGSSKRLTSPPVRVTRPSRSHQSAQHGSRNDGSNRYSSTSREQVSRAQFNSTASAASPVRHAPVNEQLMLQTSWEIPLDTNHLRREADVSLYRISSPS